MRRESHDQVADEPFTGGLSRELVQVVDDDADIDRRRASQRPQHSVDGTAATHVDPERGQHR